MKASLTAILASLVVGILASAPSASAISVPIYPFHATSRTAASARPSHVEAAPANRSNTAFSLGDAGIGAAAALVLVAGGSALSVMRRRQPGHPATG
jgi:hypothetical protein